jgi:hypothetical protein
MSRHAIVTLALLALIGSCKQNTIATVTPQFNSSTPTIPFLGVQLGGGKQVDTAQQRSIILERAQAWADAQVPYNQQAQRNGYRTDCSGFVSYAWQLTDSPDTTSFVSKGYAVDIPIEKLQPADALNNKRPGNEGHIVIFVRWLDSVDKTRFEAYDMNTYPGFPSKKTFTSQHGTNGWTIVELEPYAKGPYYAQRRKDLP